MDDKDINYIKQMQDNDPAKGNNATPQQLKQMSSEDAEYFFSLPEANPIKKREKLQPHSIFPILPLPNFLFSNEVPEPTSSVVFSVNDRLILPSISLANIFRDSIYVFNERALRKNNSDFGCIKVKYSESGVHKKLVEVVPIQKRVQEEENIRIPQQNTQINDYQANPTQPQNTKNIESKNHNQTYFNMKVEERKRNKRILSCEQTNGNVLNINKEGDSDFSEAVQIFRKTKRNLPLPLQNKNNMKSKSIQFKKKDLFLETGNREIQDVRSSSMMAGPTSDQLLQFQSRFQSGNLCFAAKSQIESNSYYLTLTRDYNTSKCTQWFFFRVKNNNPGKATFHILNFIKNYSVFENGMKICIAAKSNSFKWTRGCEEIKYRKTNIPVYLNSSSKRSSNNSDNMTANNNRCYYSLSFSYNFTEADDEVFFSYCYPYTYSMLQNFMWKSQEQSQYFKRRNIASTPGNNCVDLVTITNFKQKQYQKRTVFVMARVHPGQTPSSFVCEGMMRFLMSDTPEAASLRDSFIFKFVPMLNPDGVINGSYRCSLSGYDLNRVWHKADRVSHPEIYATAKTIFQINQKSKIFLIVDLHAHSKKKGIFMYGSQNRNNPYLCRQIPFLLWKNINEFNYYQCNFSMRLGREGTSRLFLYQELGLNYSYTMEHSFCGPSKERIHFTSKDYNHFGVNFLKTLNKYYYILRKKNISEQEEYFKDLYVNKELLKVGDAADGGSSMDEELDPEPMKQVRSVAIEEKKMIIAKRQMFRMSDNSINRNKLSARSSQKKNKIESTQTSFREPTIVKFMHTNRFNETARPIPVVELKRSEEEDIQISVKKQRVCYSSLTKSGSKNLSMEKYPMRETYRYEEEDEINSLSNLFLPSLTSASYKKYARKAQNSHNMVYIGKNFIDNAITLKEEIKSVKKKKMMRWEDHARSYL